MKDTKTIFDIKLIKLSSSKKGVVKKSLLDKNNTEKSSQLQKTLQHKADKEECEDKDNENERLSKLKDKPEHMLLHIKGMFPFAFFPEEIVIDEENITVYKAYFIKSYSVKTIVLEVIEDVECELTLFLATLVLHIRGEKDPMLIGALRLNDAFIAKEIILGPILLKKEGIKIDKVDEKKLPEVLTTIGNSHMI